MEIDEIWERFQKTLDIAEAGRRILELAKKLKWEIILFLRGGKERRTGRKGRSVELIGAELIPILKPRAHWKYPSETEFNEALDWALRRVEERVEAMRISRVSEFDLTEQIEIVRALINEFRIGGRERVSLREISLSVGSVVMALLALLFLEKKGEVLLLQDEPFGDISVVLIGELLGEGEEVI